MAGYPDPEVLVVTWLGERLDYKVWADPLLPDNWNFTAPIGHVQRGQDFSDATLTLDFALLDIDWYAAKADTARLAAAQCRDLMRLELPGYTWPSGVFCKSVETVMPPVWAPDGRHFRRSAAYRLVLHVLVSD